MPISVFFGQAPPFAPILRYVQHYIQHIQAANFYRLSLFRNAFFSLFILFLFQFHATALQSIRLREISPFDTFSFSLCQLDGSDKSNIIPDRVHLGGSAHYYEKERVGENFKAAFFHICENIVAAYNYKMQYDLFYGPGFGLKNYPQCVEMAKEFIGPVLCVDNIITCEPLLGAESMSKVSLYFPGVFGLLGTANHALGSGADMYTPAFDVDEDVLPLGVAAIRNFRQLALNGQSMSIAKMLVIKSGKILIARIGK